MVAKGSGAGDADEEGAQRWMAGEGSDGGASGGETVEGGRDGGRGDDGGQGGGEGGGEEACLRLNRCRVEGVPVECRWPTRPRGKAVTGSAVVTRAEEAVRAAAASRAVVWAGWDGRIGAADVVGGGGAWEAVAVAVGSDDGGGGGSGWQMWQKDWRRDVSAGLESMVETMAT